MAEGGEVRQTEVPSQAPSGREGESDEQGVLEGPVIHS